MHVNQPSARVKLSPSGRLARCAVCAACAAGALGLFARLAVPKPAQAAAPRPASDDRDAQLGLDVRTRLLEDPVLAPLNLGVTVSDRVAVIWGAVPSSADAARAEDAVRGTAGIVRVRSEMHVDGEKKQDTPAISQSARAAWAKARNQSPPAGESFPQWLPNKIEQTSSAAEPSRPKAPAPQGDNAPVVPAELRTSAKKVNGGQEVLPDIDIPRPTSKRAVRPVTRSYEAAHASWAPSLTDTIGDLQRRSPGFQAIRFQVQGGLVYLFHKAGSSSDAVFRMAEAVSAIPSVDRVVVKDENIGTASPATR